MGDFTFTLSTPTETLLNEIVVLGLNQGQVARTYAIALRQYAEVDWPKVNQAIVNRWSKSGLTRIKRMAWRTHELYVNEVQP